MLLISGSGIEGTQRVPVSLTAQLFFEWIEDSNIEPLEIAFVRSSNSWCGLRWMMRDQQFKPL
jgi:hypothetical protein